MTDQNTPEVCDFGTPLPKSQTLKTLSLWELLQDDPAVMPGMPQVMKIEYADFYWWIKGERFPPPEIHNRFRKFAIHCYPEHHGEIAVPGDPEYRELYLADFAERHDTPFDRLAKFLKEHGLSVSKICTMIDRRTPDQVRRVLNGRSPTIENGDYYTIAQIAKTLNVLYCDVPWVHLDQQAVAYNLTLGEKKLRDAGIDPSDPRAIDFALKIGHRDSQS